MYETGRGWSTQSSENPLRASVPVPHGAAGRQGDLLQEYVIDSFKNRRILGAFLKSHEKVRGEDLFYRSVLRIRRIGE